MATKKNLNASAENGSLLSINGFVVIKADDQRTTNINGNILTIMPYKLKLSKNWQILYLIWTLY